MNSWRFETLQRLRDHVYATAGNEFRMILAIQPSATWPTPSARVIASDGGRDTGGGSAGNTIRIDQRLQDPASLLRLLEGGQTYD